MKNFEHFVDLIFDIYKTKIQPHTFLNGFEIRIWF